MQHFNPTAFASVSAADLLRAALPAAKARAAGSGVPTWWTDYALPRDYKQESLSVTFADGVTVRCNVHTAARKPPRIAKACRVAIAFYRARTGRSGVPEMVEVRNVGTGATFDPAECSRLTADLRDFGHQPARWDLAPVPALDGPAGETEVQRAERLFGGRWYQNAKGDVLRAHEAPGIAWDGEIEQFSPVVVVEVPALDAAEIEDAAQAAWVEAVANAYGECEPAEIGGTDEPLTVAASNPAPKLIDRSPEPAVEPGAWEPSAETHPILAYCNSRAARAKLFAAIQDGTFPAEIQDAKAGVFRLTLADARDCARIPRIKLVAPLSLAA